MVINNNQSSKIFINEYILKKSLIGLEIIDNAEEPFSREFL